MFTTTDLAICTPCAHGLANGGCDGCESCAFRDGADCPDVAGELRAAVWGERARRMSVNCDDDVCDHDRDGNFRSRTLRTCDGCGRERLDHFHGAAIVEPVTEAEARAEHDPCFGTCQSWGDTRCDGWGVTD